MGACINSSQPLKKIFWKGHAVLEIFVPQGPYYPESHMSFPSWSFPQPPSSTRVPQNCRTKRPKTAWWKQRDYNDDLMGMTLHFDLQFMACLVCTSENLSTASGVKHGNIVQSWKFEYQHDLAGHAPLSTQSSFLCSSTGSRKPFSKTLLKFFHNIGLLY